MKKVISTLTKNVSNFIYLCQL